MRAVVAKRLRKEIYRGKKHNVIYSYTGKNGLQRINTGIRYKYLEAKKEYENSKKH